uniref:Dolichyl-diphosphooligosaccharide--protein glycosyltransferase subunit 2 n=1 Tax=Eptatretus burgeri TaxID=7764 RepID=A0A8C4NFG1_EPTBU
MWCKEQPNINLFLPPHFHICDISTSLAFPLPAFLMFILLFEPQSTKGILLIAVVVAVANALIPRHYFSPADVERLEASLRRPYDSLEDAYHSTIGLKALGKKPSDAKALCNFVKSAGETEDAQSLFYIASVSAALPECKVTLGQDVQQRLLAGIHESAPVSQVYHSVGALSSLGLPLSSQQSIIALTTGLAREDNPISTTEALFAACFLSQQADLARIAQEVEDLVARADDHGKVYLQFEEGVEATALFIAAAYELANHIGADPPIKQDQLLQFANAILVRKSHSSLSEASAVARAAGALSNNRFHVPVVVRSDGSAAMSRVRPSLRLRVTDVLSRPLPKAELILERAREAVSRKTVLSQVAFSASGDMHEFDFLQANPQRGYFDLSLVVEGDGSFIGKEVEMRVKFATDVVVSNMEVSTVDKDQSMAAKITQVPYPSKASSTFMADGHQKLALSFKIIDKHSGDILTPQQAFIRIQSQRSGQEVIFVAEPDPQLLYRFELDPQERRAQFGAASGTYSVFLVVGDATIDNPLHWHLGDVLLKFSEEDGPPIAKTEKLFTSKPEIEHMFRQPEKRPTRAVSNAFTFMVLCPLLLLFVLWFNLGVNLRNFTFAPSTILFHLGLGSMLVLLYMFWSHLNMFDMLKYLTAVGGFTFLAGNRMLSQMAAKRISSEHSGWPPKHKAALTGGKPK